MTSVVMRTSVETARGQSLAIAADSLDSILLDNAVNGLRAVAPEMSAGTPLAAWQRSAIYCFAIITPVVAGMFVLGQADWLAAALTLPFVAIILLRWAALWRLIWPSRHEKPEAAALLDDALPTYSIVIPLYQEAAVAPALVQAIAELDYPPDKLDVIFVTEENDELTRTALAYAKLRPHMRIVTVPHGLPKTKPRACNYALQRATGDCVVVYDAEDVPEPGQLRKAAARFAVGGPKLVCLQARLSIYNPRDSFLTKQFTLEYSILFEAILPALERLGLPIMLGGTSNHFRRSALVAAGAWDAFNVTEDADLGVRLARLGLSCEMLDSDTWEEAPRTSRAWMGQRTRWLKGWMQTYLVHMRSPRQLLSDLGAWRFFGLQIMLAGTILSALIHPWFYTAAVFCLFTGTELIPGGGVLGFVCWFNFVAGHAIGVLLGVLSAWRSHGRIPLSAAIDLPVYWLAISAASYRAIWDLYKRPFYWEKTAHSARRVTPSVGGA